MNDAENILMTAIVLYVSDTYGREGVTPEQWEAVYWKVHDAIRHVIFEPDEPT